MYMQKEQEMLELHVSESCSSRSEGLGSRAYCIQTQVLNNSKSVSMIDMVYIVGILGLSKPNRYLLILTRIHCILIMYNFKCSISFMPVAFFDTQCWNLYGGNRRISFSVEELVQLLLGPD